MTNGSSPVEYVVEASKLSPPAVATGITAAGVSLQDWVYIVTIAYTLMMAAHLVYKWVKERRSGS